MIDDCIGCAMSGLTADARTLMEHGRVETQVSKSRCTTFVRECFYECGFAAGCEQGI